MKTKSERNEALYLDLGKSMGFQAVERRLFLTGKDGKGIKVRGIRGILDGR